jgi:TPR repeat protein
LGNSYHDGDGFEKDLKEAVRYFKLAADQGYGDAQEMLGSAYQDGIGVAKNISKAAKYYRLAADNGRAKAQYELGKWYLTRNKATKAAKLIRASADQGYEDAQDYLRTIMCDRLVDVHICGWCAQEIIGARRCARCQQVFYCDSACQKKHWKTHKKCCEAKAIPAEIALEANH